LPAPESPVNHRVKPLLSFATLPVPFVVAFVAL
jgi:hypothetical protein